MNYTVIEIATLEERLMRCSHIGDLSHALLWS